MPTEAAWSESTAPESTAPGLREAIGALIAEADLARSDSRRQGDELRPLGKKAKRTRAHLLVHAHACFVENGYRDTSVEDIHLATGVSIGTFYQYFRDKADLMTTMVAEAVHLAADALEAGLDGDEDPGAAGSALALVRRFIANYAATASFQAVWEEATHFEPKLAEFRRQVSGLVEAGLAEQIVSGQRTGTGRADVEPREAARALASMVDRHCYVTFVADGRCDPASVAAASALVIDLWEHALGMRSTS